MKVSILMPFYNRESIIADAIDSVLGQTFSDFEFVIYNDGSTDNSELIVKNYMNDDPRIKYFESKKNKGINFSRNFLIDKSSCDIIAWIDSDDIISKNKIESQIKIIENLEASMVVSNYVFFRHGQSISSKKLNTRISRCDVDIINKNKKFTGKEKFCFASIMCKKLVFEKYRFDESVVSGGDLIWINECLKDFIFHSDENSVYYIRRHNERVSFKKRYEKCIESGNSPEENTWIISNNVSIRRKI